MRKNYTVDTDRLPPVAPPQQKVRDHLLRAIHLHSTRKNLARAVDTSATRIGACLIEGRVVPGLALRIEKATEGKVNRYELCPEIFDVPDIPEPGFVGRVVTRGDLAAIRRLMQERSS